MKRTHVSILLLWFFSTSLNAQEGKSRWMKWGKVEPEYLKMTQYAPDTAAAAVILGKQGQIIVTASGDELCVRYEFHKRVKILKESAFEDFGNIEMEYSADRQFDRFESMDAQVIQPDGSIIELKRSDFIDEKTTKDYKTRKFAFKQLKVGSVVEYKFQRYSTLDYRGAMLYPWYFQEAYPIVKSDLRLQIPLWFDYIYLFQGEKSLKIIDRYVEPQVLYPGTTVKTSISHYAVDSIEAFRPEGYISTPEDYLVRLRFQLKQIIFDDFSTRPFLSTWQKMAEDWSNRKDIGQQITKKSNHDNVWAAVQPLLTEAKTTEEKIKIVYQYLSNNVKWNGEYDYSADQDLNEAFEKKTANSAELNLMFLACLHEMGIQALPCLVSTRNHGRPITTYPIAWQFNHLMAYVELEGKPTFIDVGNAQRPYNLPRFQSLNNEGWVLEKGNPRWVSLPTPPSSSVTIANFKLDTEGHLTGTLTCSYTGYAAVRAREKALGGGDNKLLKEELGKKFGECELLKLDNTNLDNPMTTFKQVIEVKIQNAAVISDELMYIKPLFNGDFEQSPFKLANRAYPVDFDNPIRDQYVLNLTLPEGYVLDELPKPVNIVLPDEAGKMLYASSVNGSTIQLILRLSINNLHFDAADYPYLREFFSQVATKQTEQIVIKKK